MDRTVPTGAALLLDYDVAMEVAAHEALIRQTYKDRKGILTWCIGMTNATGHRVERYVGKPASLQTCMDVYVWALDNYAAGVREVFKGHSITKAQFAAALSFHWNTGAIKTATWVKHFKAGDMTAAKKAFMNWVSPPEIKARRQKERDLFFDGKWSNDGTMTKYTRLRANMQPDFSSGRRLDVSKELRAAMAERPRPVLDQKPQPDSKPAAPTLSPDRRDVPAEPAVVIPEPAFIPGKPAPQASKPGPLAKSKRLWTWLTTGGTGVGVLSGVAGLDVWLQRGLGIILIGLAAYAIVSMPDVRKKLGLS